MTLDQLRYALAVSTHQNFSRAAEACHITQPSLSMQIAKLESELGVLLFDRTRSRVEITDYGRRLLEQARLIIDEVQRLSQSAMEMKGQVQGPFRLGLIPTLAPTLLPLFLGAFREALPNVQLSVVEEPTHALIDQLSRGSLDGAILSTPEKCPDAILERVLFYEPFAVYASSAHPLLDLKNLTPEALKGGDILLLDETHCLRDQVLKLCHLRQEQTSSLQIRSGSLQTLIEVLRKQPGFTLLPILSVASLSARELKNNVRNFAKPVPVRKVSLVFHKAHLKRSILEGLREQILKTLPETVFKTAQRSQVRVIAPEPDHFEI